MAEATLILQTTDKSGAEAIDRIIQDNGGSAGIVTQPKNLSGEVATWIVAVTAFTQALPPLLAAIKDLMARDRVKELDIAGVKVTNPTPEVVERLLKEHLGPGR
jgi:hypothetical protein